MGTTLFPAVTIRKECQTLSTTCKCTSKGGRTQARLSRQRKCQVEGDLGCKCRGVAEYPLQGQS